MAAEHLTAADLQAYENGMLSPHELLRVSDHLAECAACRAGVDQSRKAPVLELSGDEEPLTYETLADYLDDQLDPARRWEVDEQLRRSPQAAAGLADLRRFRDATNAAAGGSKLLHFPRALLPWLLPLAALFLLSLGALWWQAGREDGPGLITKQTLAGLPPDLRAAVTTAVETGRLKIPSEVESLGGPPETLASSPGEKPGFRVVRPIATAIREARPQFQWTAREGASGYRVLVAETGSGKLVATGKINGAETTWQPATPLAAGQSYQWQVEAWRDGKVIERVPRPPEPEARFAILSAQAQNDFEKIEKQSNHSHLVRAVAAARAGLLDDAAAELRELAKEHPDSKLPARLLAQLAR